jgi:uncharacterized protein (TIGR03067 family)
MQPVLQDPSAVREDAARRDRVRLQGTWNYLSGSREARLLIRDDQFTVRFKQGEVYHGTFTLDPTRRPKAMDMTVTDGPEDRRGKTALCIYQIDGDHLIWCPSPPGSGERLRAFPPEGDCGNLCIIFRREKADAAGT